MGRGLFPLSEREFVFLQSCFEGNIADDTNKVTVSALCKLHKEKAQYFSSLLWMRTYTNQG